MQTKPRLVGIKGFSPTQAPAPNEQEYEVVYSYRPDETAKPAAPVKPKAQKGLLNSLFPWIFK